MSDLISMKQLITELEIEIGEIYNEEICYGLKRAIEIIKQRPTVEAKPVVHGKWIFVRDMIPYYRCSNCSATNDYALANFCQNCGCDMREDVE